MGLLETLMPGVAPIVGAGETWYTNRETDKRAHEQMDFQQQQFSTRYQTQVKDLQAAGLNPMLAYGQSPGQAPQGSAGPVSKPQIGELYNQSRLATAQEAQLTAQAQKTYAEEKNINADTLIKAGMPELLAAQTAAASSSASHNVAMVQEIQNRIPKIQQEINNLQQEIKKSKSDVKLNNELAAAQQYLNSLRIAETFLTSQRSRTESLNADILDPKAKAARTNTAELGAVADNIGKIGSAAWKFMFPTLTGGH